MRGSDQKNNVVEWFFEYGTLTGEKRKRLCKKFIVFESRGNNIVHHYNFLVGLFPHAFLCHFWNFPFSRAFTGPRTFQNYCLFECLYLFACPEIKWKNVYNWKVSRDKSRLSPNDFFVLNCTSHYVFSWFTILLNSPFMPNTTDNYLVAR